jgi:hypothetical protein
MTTAPASSLLTILRPVWPLTEDVDVPSPYFLKSNMAWLSGDPIPKEWGEQKYRRYSG